MNPPVMSGYSLQGGAVGVECSGVSGNRVYIIYLLTGLYTNNNYYIVYILATLLHRLY